MSASLGDAPALWMNGAQWPLTTEDDLAPLHTALLGKDMLEVRLQRTPNIELVALVNSDRGLIVHNQNEPWESWSSRDPSVRPKRGKTALFTLSNGQVDEFPIEWTLPRSSLPRYFEHFWETGCRLHADHWHQD